MILLNFVCVIYGSIIFNEQIGRRQPFWRLPQNDIRYNKRFCIKWWNILLNEKKKLQKFNKFMVEKKITNIFEKLIRFSLHHYYVILKLFLIDKNKILDYWMYSPYGLQWKIFMFLSFACTSLLLLIKAKKNGAFMNVCLPCKRYITLNSNAKLLPS